MTKIHSKLNAIQSALKAPKSQFNKFGGYNYRKAEDILEAVKPLLKEQGCVLTCTDDLLLVGERYYIKATATITCVEDGSAVSTTAYAREEEEKKGMDGSQVTGASSSYARKYALNGLLCIDDTADSDTTNQGEGKEKKPARKQTPAQAPVASAPVSDPNQPQYTPVSPRQYWNIVKAYAEGRRTKSGGDYRTEWARSTNAGTAEILKFDKDVADFQAGKSAMQQPI